ncbi:hypothetical protein SUGI_0878940 [Cryptomeria japonica]|nr:hypothetical protein SUGI_0878940 [Cryptomeria japonica]
MLAIWYKFWDKHGSGFVVMYWLTFFFANFGPNSTTFIVPAELFPARFWSTCHGLSAAMGKLGAIIGAFGVGYLADDKYGKDKLTLALYLLACTNGKSLE